MSDDERILVIPAGVIERIGRIDGFTSHVDQFLPPILASDQLCFRPRGEMETDPQFKQLIPYVVLTLGEGPDMRFFTYVRGGGGGESRLHAKWSIGIGGHISEEDAAGGADPYRTGMRRELAEEVTITSEYDDRCVGLIYDPSTEVGRVHLGIVHQFRLESDGVTSNEADIAEGAFRSWEDLVRDRDRLETWSQLALEHFVARTDGTDAASERSR